ncbi:MAG TPA: hypothetical protein VHB50_05090, partial [Bryobacteraceae bacterium]|nr:hypothetical protein [Bryobacteraceae bacterium]
SLKSELDRSEESKRIFLYEIDLSALNEDGRKAVEGALRGDFKAITLPGAALQGIRELHSALTLSSQTVHTFALHLLGIFNAGNTETFLRQAKINYTKDTREIVLSDEKIEVTDNNLKAEKLREVLLKAVTLTLPAGANTPDSEITLNMVFFDRHAGTNASQLRQFVNVLQAMGAPDAAGAAGLLSRNLGNWGATTLYLGLNLDKKRNSALFRRANGQPWRHNDYLLQARDAMATILANDPDSAGRRKLFTVDLSFWDALREAGSGANVTRLLTQNAIPATSVTDFFAIDRWAGAMAKYAEALASGSSLEAAGKQIVKTSGGGFNEPWALYAVWALLENPEVTARFTCSIPMATPAAQTPRSS